MQSYSHAVMQSCSHAVLLRPLLLLLLLLLLARFQETFHSSSSEAGSSHQAAERSRLAALTLSTLAARVSKFKPLTAKSWGAESCGFWTVHVSNEKLGPKYYICFHSCNKRLVADPSPHLVAGVATKRALVSPPIEGWPITLARRQPLVRWFVTLGGRSQTLAHTPECKGSLWSESSTRIMGVCI